MSNAQRTNILITKWVLLALIFANIAYSVLMFVFSVKNYKRLQSDDSEDWYSNERTESYYAKGWMIAALFVLSFADVLSLGVVYGIFREKPLHTIIYGVLMSCISSYIAFDKYLGPKLVTFILPQVIAILAILFSGLVYAASKSDPLGRDAVMTLTKRNGPYDEVNKTDA